MLAPKDIVHKIDLSKEEQVFELNGNLYIQHQDFLWWVHDHSQFTNNELDIIVNTFIDQTHSTGPKCVKFPLPSNNYYIPPSNMGTVVISTDIKWVVIEIVGPIIDPGDPLTHSEFMKLIKGFTDSISSDISPVDYFM